jgi:hypothetical protein
MTRGYPLRSTGGWSILDKRTPEACEEKLAVQQQPPAEEGSLEPVLHFDFAAAASLNSFVQSASCSCWTASG